MELGEILYAISKGVIRLVEGEMNKQDVPLALRPLVIENVRAYFVDKAYDHLVAVHIQEHNKTETEEK